MTKIKKIVPVLVEMSEDQLAQLKKLFTFAKRNPLTGVIVGQVRENGICRFAFMTPEQLIASAKNMKSQREKIQSFNPANK